MPKGCSDLVERMSFLEKDDEVDFPTLAFFI